MKWLNFAIGISKSAKQTWVVSGVTTVAAIAGLAATQGLITNHQEKLVCGIAAIALPVAGMLANALHHLAGARVTAARIMAGLPTSQQPPPAS